MNAITDEGHRVASDILCSSNVRDCSRDVSNCTELKIISLNYGNSNIFKPLTNDNVNHGLYTQVKFSRYRPCVAQKVGRRIALLFHDRGTRRG